MKVSLRRLARIPPVWKWGAMLVSVALLVFLLWFFFLRGSQAGGGAARPPVPRTALGQVIMRQAYVAAVESALSDVRSAKGVTGEPRKRLLEKASQTLEGVEGAGILSASGSLPVIDNTAVIEEMQADSPDVDGLESSLAVLEQGVRSEVVALLPGTANGDKAREELRAVLSDAAFNYERNLSPLQRLARWLAGLTGQADPGDTLWRWFSALVAGLAAASVTYLATDSVSSKWARLGLALLAGLLVGTLFFFSLQALGVTVEILGAVGFVVAAVAVALLLTGVRRTEAPERPRAISELAAVLGMSAAEARGRAEEAVSAGDFRSAIRYRCLGLLLSLDEAGMLHFDRTATNREYLFKAPGALHDDLQPLLDTFDAVWYGGKQASEEQWHEYTAKAEQIERRVASETPAGRASSSTRARGRAA